MNPAPPDATVAAPDLTALLDLADPSRNAPVAEAAEAARRASALALERRSMLEAGRAAAWLCGHLFRLGRLVATRQQALDALPLLERSELRPERCETLRLLALASSETAAFDLALDAANRLMRESAESPAGGDPGLALTAAYALAVCFERMGDSWQAMRLMSEAMAEHGKQAPLRERLIGANAVCALTLGTWHRVRDVDSAAVRAALLDRASAGAEEALGILTRVREPTYEVAVRGNLGEVRLHQGDIATARILLDQAHQLAMAGGLAAHGWRIEASRGAWLLSQDRPEEALAAMTAVLGDMSAAEGTPPVSTEIRVRDVAYRACRAMTWHEAALAHFEVVERLERQRTVAQLRALSSVFVTRTEAAQARRQAERQTDEARAEALRQQHRAAEFARSAEQDVLTGLANRRHFERRIEEMLATAAEQGRPLALALLDVDHFKRINDGFGHAAGDAVLTGLAQLLRENMRGVDLLARLGGKEFVVLLPDTPLSQACEVCERLRERIEQRPWPDLPGLGSVTASIGLALTPPYEARTLLQRADGALYAAKGAGRNRLTVATT